MDDDPTIQLALQNLRMEVRPLEILGLSRIDHESDRVTNTFTYRFSDGHEPVTLTEDEFMSPTAIIKLFLAHRISLPVKTNWELFRMYSMAGSYHVQKPDGWANYLTEFVNMRSSVRDFLIDPTSVQLLIRGSATSVGYGDTHRLMSLYQFSTWISKQRKRTQTVEMCATKLAQYCVPVESVYQNMVSVAVPIVPVMSL